MKINVEEGIKRTTQALKELTLRMESRLHEIEEMDVADYTEEIKEEKFMIEEYLYMHYKKRHLNNTKK